MRTECGSACGSQDLQTLFISPPALPSLPSSCTGTARGLASCEHGLRADPLHILGPMFSLLIATQAFTSEKSPDCVTAIVGGGWAGVYAAWRLTVDAKSVPASELCLFEARSAVGGRTYSVSVDSGDDALIVDVGAYRFGGDQHLPADLIIKRLNISVACYQPDCAPDDGMHQTLYKVVDAEGRNAGYVTPILSMLAELVAGGADAYLRLRLRFRRRLRLRLRVTPSQRASPELTRTPRRLRWVRTGCAYQPPALGTYRTHRAACPQGPACCTHWVRVPASGGRTLRTPHRVTPGRSGRAGLLPVPAHGRLPHRHLRARRRRPLAALCGRCGRVGERGAAQLAARLTAPPRPG